MRQIRPVSAAVLVVVGCAFAGGFYGRASLMAQDQLPEQYRVFTSALRAVEETYVGNSEPDRLVYSAIAGMLQTLDPHSSFMDARSYAQMRERQEGRYYGLGIRIGVQNEYITVDSVFEGSPAYQKGMRRGDVIARIEGEDTKGWTSEQAVLQLRGPRGTAVNISVRRNGYDQLIDMQVTRDEIYMPTIPVAFMMDDTTGYVKITDFGENTDQELGQALRDLSSKGMRRLVLDLRTNPGGALDQAIKVSNRFLPQNEMIVYTRGRVSNSGQDYRATSRSEYLNLPMVTLVDRRSASASEIVSGALQDHDRSLIVGETTFGKALVQSVFRVSGGAGAAITTARYYTPSGRMIQRPWDGSFDEYLTYAQREQDANRAHRDEDLKLTDSGRRVYSGGGIEPDHHVDGPVMGFNPGRFARMLYGANGGVFATFSERFSRQGDTRVDPAAARDLRTLAADFQVTDALVDEFKRYVTGRLEERRLPFDEAAWEADQLFIRTMLRFEIDRDLFGEAVAWQHLVAIDPQVQRGVVLFPEAQRLLDTSRAVAAGRRAQR